MIAIILNEKKKLIETIVLVNSLMGITSNYFT